MLIPNPTYDAFISYSREDAPLAAKFQAAVQGFARPWYRRRSLRLFRDMSNLSASESLQRELEVALNNAKYLILLASPSAAASEWVNREISYWLSKKSIRTIILVKVNGTIQWDPQARDFCFDEGTAVPKSLQGVYGAEPIWVDLPAAVLLMANRTESKRAVGQVVARIRGVELDQILGEDLRQQRRTWISVSAFSCLMVFLILAGVVAYRQSLIEEKAKQQQALMAKSRLLALQSQAALEQKNDTLALQSALASFSIVTSPVSLGALVSVLVETRHLDKQWRVLNANANQPPVDAMALGGSVEQPLLITGDNKGAIAIYDRHSGQALQLFEAAHSTGCILREAAGL